MDFRKCIKIFSQTLKEKNPSEFSSTWILQNAPSAYHFISKNVRSEIGQIGWDKITVALSRRYQHRWIRYQHKPRKTYEDQAYRLGTDMRLSEIVGQDSESGEIKTYG